MRARVFPRPTHLVRSVGRTTIPPCIRLLTLDSIGATRSFWQEPTEKDLYDMAYEINRLVSNSNIKIKSQAVMNAVRAVVLRERHVNAYRDAHGISIYHISKSTDKDSNYTYYLTLDFAQRTRWDEFLNAYAIK